MYCSDHYLSFITGSLKNFVYTVMFTAKVIFFFLVFTVAFGLIVSFCWYLSYSNEPSWKTVFAESSIEGILSPCSLLDDGGFNAWKEGLVTVMKPQISKNCSLLFEGDSN